MNVGRLFEAVVLPMESRSNASRGPVLHRNDHEPAAYWI